MKKQPMRTESVPMGLLHHVPNRDTLLVYQGYSREIERNGERRGTDNTSLTVSGSGIHPNRLKTSKGAHISVVRAEIERKSYTHVQKTCTTTFWAICNPKCSKRDL